MKNIATGLLFILTSPMLIAQGTLKGSVSTENNEPLVGAHIYISEIEKGTIADNAGRFRFTNLNEGAYSVEICFLGFITEKFSIKITDGLTAELNTKLQEGGLQLADVVVTATQNRPINILSQVDIKLRPITTSQDILRMVPGLFIGHHSGRCPDRSDGCCARRLVYVQRRAMCHRIFWCKAHQWIVGSDLCVFLCGDRKYHDGPRMDFPDLPICGRNLDHASDQGQIAQKCNPFLKYRNHTGNM